MHAFTGLAIAGLSYISAAFVLIPALPVPAAFPVPCAPVAMEFTIMNPGVGRRQVQGISG